MSDWLHLDITLTLGDYALTAKGDIPLTGITALEGASGSGKTTLLRSIAGLEPSAKGMIRFGDVVWQGDGVFLPPQSRRIGYVFQDARLFKHMDVAQNLAYGHKRAGAAPEVLERVITALDLSDMLTRRVGALSGGEKQRVAIGRALAMDPQLLLMDEPMTGLDRARRNEILPYIARAVQASGCPAIYVSHERRETSMMAGQIMQILDGQLQAPVACETSLPYKLRQTDRGPVLYISKQETRLPVSDTTDQSGVLRFNEAGVMLSTDNPGGSTAAVCLPAKLIEVIPAADNTCRLVLQGDAWRIVVTKQKPRCELVDLTVGMYLWVSINEICII
jgi:molybdate transport system ATP-binding protein